ncbi:unnamed protein product [Soboliphyme baturini]|uniref:CPSF_A domain-containing protein n=1 Tax=Soboliphyme baturini TaxID=241478 RepID=A0A183I9F8_9BILA|nr:unnamed protein product [Soboliphyme baturini]
MLQNLLVSMIPHAAGLNPRPFHTAKTSIPELSNPQKNILDGNLLYKYLDLNRVEKQELAKRIGSTREQLVEDILEIERQITHY